MKPFAVGLLVYAADTTQTPAAVPASGTAANINIETVRVWATQAKSSWVYLGENQIAAK